MPSLIGTNVTTNYLRMPAQHQYGVGEIYSNFGTRQLRLLKVTAVTGATGSTTAVDFSATYTASNSTFSKAIRALQTGAEIYQIWVPGTAGFLVAVSEDTINDSDSNSNVASSSYGDLEAAITAAVATGTGAATVITALTVDATGIALGAVA